MLPSSVVAPKPYRAPSPHEHNGNVVSSKSSHRTPKGKHKFSQSPITNIGTATLPASSTHRFSGSSLGASLPIAITNNWQKSSPQLRGTSGGTGSPRVTSPSSPSFATAMLSGSPQQAAFIRSMMNSASRRESVDEHELAAREIVGIMHNNSQPVNIPSMRGINARAPSTPLPPLNRSSFLSQIQQSNSSVGLFFSHSSSAFSQAAPFLLNKTAINSNLNSPINTSPSNNNTIQNNNPPPSTINTSNAMALLSQSPTTPSMTLGTSPSLAAMSPPMRSANPVIRDDRFHFERDGSGIGLGLGLGLAGFGGGMGLGGGGGSGLPNEVDGMAALRLDDPHGMPRVEESIGGDSDLDNDSFEDPVSVSMSAESDNLII